MLGTFVRMEKPMADNDDINDLCICGGVGKVTGGHKVVLFNNKYFRYMNKGISEKYYALGFGQVSVLHFTAITFWHLGYLT